MKKMLLSGMLLCFIVASGFSQIRDFDQLCDKYKHYEDVETVKMGRFGCFLASLFVDGKDGVAGKFIKKSSSFRLLTCEGNTLKGLNKDVAEFISSNKLEELMTVTEKESQVKIYIQDKDKVIRQVFLSVADKKDMVFIQVEGKFPLELIRDIVKEK